MDTTTKKVDSQAVRRLAPEDIKPGQFVTIHKRTGEVFYMASACESAFVEPSVKVLRFGYTPEHSGLPFRVKEVCLPFVLASNPEGQFVTLDTRKMELVALSDGYGKEAFKSLRQTHKKNGSKAK